MVKGKLKTIWTKKAEAQLRQIHDYIKYEKKSPKGATNVKNDILKASKGITFSEQYQKDEINTNYRRILVRHYKLLYKEKNGKIIILRVFDTLQNPTRLLKGND